MEDKVKFVYMWMCRSRVIRGHMSCNYYGEMMCKSARELGLIVAQTGKIPKKWKFVP